MARRPAYNTKAERARRAVERESLLVEIANFGEEANELTPLLSAWVQFKRRENDYRILFGQDYSRYRSEVPEDLRILEAREHAQMAFAMSYVGTRAGALAQLFAGFAGDASLYGMAILQQELPYTDDQVALLRALYGNNP